MKVAIITRDYPPKIGGISTHVRALGQALERQGTEVKIFVGGSDYKTLILPLTRSLDKFDLVHVQSAPYGAFVGRRPMAVTVHSPILIERDHYRRMTKLTSVPALYFERISLKRAKMIFAVSQVTKNQLTGNYAIDAEKVCVIGNGVEYERFAPREYGTTRSPHNIFLASRLEPRK